MQKTISITSILARNTLASWINYAVAVGTTVFVTPLVINGIGTAAYGVMVLINQITGYAGLLDLGLQPAVVKYVSRARAENDREQLRAIVSTGLLLQLAIGTLALLVVLAVRPSLKLWFHFGDVAPAELEQAFLILGLSAVLGFPASVFSAALKGYQRLDLVSWIGVVSQLVRAAGTVLAVSWDYGLVGLALAGLVANSIGYLGATLLMFKESRALWPRLDVPSPVLVRSLLSFGLYSAIGTAGWHLSHASDALVISSLLTATDVAHFGLAISILAIVSGIVSSFSASFMPLASELKAREATEDVRQTYLFGTRVSLLLAFPFVIVLYLWGQELLTLWVGEEFGSATTPILRVLVLAHAVMMANASGLPMAIGIGLHRLVALVTLAQGLVNIVLSCWLATTVGVIGVAIGTLLPVAITHGIVFPYVLSSHLEISIRRLLSDGIFPALSYGLPLAVSLSIIRWVPTGFSSQGTSLLASGALAVLWMCVVLAMSLRAARRDGEGTLHDAIPTPSPPKRISISDN